MEYAEKGSLADMLRKGRLQRPDGSPDLIAIISCLQDIASGAWAQMLHACMLLPLLAPPPALLPITGCLQDIASGVAHTHHSLPFSCLTTTAACS